MNEADYKAIRKRVERIYEMRSEYFSHLISFVVLNGLVLLAINNTDEAARNYFFINVWYFIAAMWGVGMAIHTVQYFLGMAKEKAIQKAIEREHEYRMALAAKGQVYEKPKRDRLVLNDDGEIEEIIDEEEPGRIRMRR
ncbi:MAG TPA: 2TM domain-containing protein [Aggregatilineales bacterium]|nr:2TM domain-containing protein [Aggregatilineales bacterium]